MKLISLQNRIYNASEIFSVTMTTGLKKYIVPKEDAELETGEVEEEIEETEEATEEEAEEPKTPEFVEVEIEVPEILITFKDGSYITAQYDTSAEAQSMKSSIVKMLTSTTDMLLHLDDNRFAF